MLPTTIQLGDMLNVPVAGAITAGGSLCCAGFSGTVIAVTDKAVRLSATTENGAEIDAWFPRKAFTKVSDRGLLDNQRLIGAGLARWFRPSGWTARFVALATVNSTLGVAA